MSEFSEDSGRPGTWACAGCGWEGEARDSADAAWQHDWSREVKDHEFVDADALAEAVVVTDLPFCACPLNQRRGRHLPSCELAE